MTDFVLVHGAWHGGWCWDRVEPRLASAGHRCFTPELPIDQAFDDCARVVESAVLDCDEPVVLVGHSMAGAVIAQVAEAMPERIARLVFLAAFTPANNESINSLLPLNVASALRDNLELSGGMLHVKPDTIRQAFYHDCEETDVAFALAQLRPQNPAVFDHKLALTDARFGSVPKHYIECVEDQAVHIWLQRKMARDMGATHINSLQTGHSPFFSAPAALTALIATVGIKDARR